VLGAAVAVLGPLAALAPGLLLIDVPDGDGAVRDSAALISYSDGTELARLAGGPDRPRVPLARVPAHVREAVLAVTDPDFDARPPLDPSGLLRMVTTADPAVGPIAGQLASRALAGFAPSPWRAYRELVLVSKLSAQRDPDLVLTDFLNAVYLGRGAYGVGQGALEWFGKDVLELTVEEAAVLAGLIGAPWDADPATDPVRAQHRFDQVLDAMVARGALSPAQRAQARFPATLPRRAGAGLPADERARVVAAVIGELRTLGFDEAQLAQGGLRVTTTLDPTRQRRADAAAGRVRAGRAGPPARVGIVAVDHATGGVLAYHGGTDPYGPDAARVAQPAGSVLAPFVVIAGQLQHPPIGPDPARPPCPGCPVDRHGEVTALARQVGPEAVAATVQAAGIQAAADPAGSAPTGTAVDALGLASAYATLAAGGVHRPAHLVAAVGTTDGRVLYRAPTAGERRLPEHAVRLATAHGLAPGTPDGPWAAGSDAATTAVVYVGEPSSTSAFAAGRHERGDPQQGAGLEAATAARFAWDELMSDPAVAGCPAPPCR
jgi:peptidoglycan glycosyltransferase